MVSTQAMKQNHLFRRLYSKGKSAAGKYVVVYCRKNGLAYNRLGITTGVKLGHAVVRNRFRRRIREAYRLHESMFLTGYDLVVVARSRGVDASYTEISDCLLVQARRLGLLRKEEHASEASASAADSILP